MIISTQIRRKSNPGVLENVLVYPDQLKTVFQLISGTPSQQLELKLRIHSTSDGTTPAAPEAQIPAFDVEKTFYASEAQLTIVDARLRGGGNLMAGVRAFCKSRVDEWNETVLPGGLAAVHIDLDDDSL